MQERWLDETNIYKSLVEEDKAERFLIPNFLEMPHFDKIRECG
jgi:hypothetical protein